MFQRKIMLLGTPRSNSTMLQRTLAQYPSVVAPELGLLLFPDRRLFRRLFELFPQALFDTFYDPRIHRTGPLMAEADDLALLSEFREGVFAWAYLQAKEGVERPIVRPEHLLFLNRVHETLSNRGDILVVKYFGGIFHPFEELSTYMSDYEFYLLCRPPREVLYSLSTLLNQAHRKRRFKADKAYWERVYRLMVYCYQRMVELSYEPKIRVLSDHEIKTELSEVLESILPGTSTLIEGRKPYKRSYNYVDVMDGIFKEDDFKEYFNRFG